MKIHKSYAKRERQDLLKNGFLISMFRIIGVFYGDLQSSLRELLGKLWFACALDRILWIATNQRCGTYWPLVLLWSTMTCRTKSCQTLNSLQFFTDELALIALNKFLPAYTPSQLKCTLSTLRRKQVKRKRPVNMKTCHNKLV